MSQAFAPRIPRGLSWVVTSIVAIMLAIPGLPASAQEVPKEKADQAKADEAKVEAPEAEGPAAEVFLDPNAKKALAKIEPLNFVGQPIRLGPGNVDSSRITSMATGQTAVDPVFLKRYIDFFAIELTKRDYINALTNPPDKLQLNIARGLENAVEALNDPMIRARANDQTAFLTTYSRVLFDSPLAKILENNLYTRIDAMIVLGTAGSTAPAALDLYTAQIRKPDQVIWVKMWAARGLTNATRQGQVNLDATKTIEAADALIGLLDSDPKLPWPVQMRALEALGSLRMAFNNIRKPVDAASVAMRFLADPEGRPEVRAWAAWALGMMKYPPNVSPLNFELLGQEIGDLAADLGKRIVGQFDADAANFERKKDRAVKLTSLLIFQVFPAFSGQDGVSDSGVLRSSHPGLTTAKAALTQIEAKVKDVTRETYELLRAPVGGQKARRDALDSKIAALKGQLSQVNPKSRRLLPDGPEFAPHAAQVAGAGRP